MGCDEKKKSKIDVAVLLIFFNRPSLFMLRIDSMIFFVPSSFGTKLPIEAIKVLYPKTNFLQFLEYIPTER